MGGRLCGVCETVLRAEPFEAGSEEYKLLELYIMSRGNGLEIETPAVRFRLEAGQPGKQAFSIRLNTL